MKAVFLAALGIAAGAAAFAPVGADSAEIDIRISSNSADVVTGSGNMASEQRPVHDFRAIESSGSMSVVLRQGAREGLELRADDNILPLIETRVVERGGVPTLVLGVKSGTGFSTRNPIVATIDLIALRALTLSGSGDATSAALKTPALALSVNGSGKVRLDRLEVDDLIAATVSGSGQIALGGRSARLAVTMAGSGDVDARDLAANDVNVRVTGSGAASVTAQRTLQISIVGAGEVSHAGAATPKVSIVGSGRVRRR